MVKTKKWQDLLRSRGWEDYHVSGPAFDAFLEAEQARMKDVLAALALLR